jgi:transitional endoplasmic reticulum ATPase
MHTELSVGQQLVRVRSISDDETTLYLELRNGLIATADNDGSLDLDVGDILLFDQTRDWITKAPSNLWRIQSLVGIVRLVSDTQTVIDTGGRWTLVPTIDEVSYRVGNTVEFDEFTGVLEVLSETSISSLDTLMDISPSILNRYRVDPTQDSGLSFGDFGGLPEVVERAKELIELPLLHHAALQEINARPVKGVLFTGEPGTGKTMLARIIANVCNATFYEISGPEIINKWVGQSEEIIRMIFDDAATKGRAIIFFDELDSIATRRESDSHELSRRVVAQLLTDLDGFKQDQNVIVIGTTNRPQDIDTALRRPGRLDWEIHFGLPSEKDRQEILEVSSRGLRTTGSLSHSRMASMTDRWSGAELTGIWTEAALLAVKDDRSAIHEEDYWGAYERVRDKRACWR